MKRNGWLLVAAALGIAGGALSLARVRSVAPGEATAPLPSPQSFSGPRRAVSLKLANRMIPAPKFGERRFAEFPVSRRLSPRGTLPFALLAEGVATREVRGRVAAAGARVIGSFGSRALLVEANAAALAALAADKSFAAAEEFLPSDKITPSLADDVAAGGDVLVCAVPLADEDIAAVGDAIGAAGGRVLKSMSAGHRFVRARVPASAVAALAERGDVRWIERFEMPHALNDVAAAEAGVDVARARNLHGLTGAGQIVGTADTGVDLGYLDATMHPDLLGRICRLKQFGIVEVDDGYVYSATHTEDLVGHGTHTAGSIVGDGSCSKSRVRGMAPGAKLYVECCGQDGDLRGYMSTPDFATLFTSDVNLFPYYIHSDSWGGSKNVYDSFAVELDEFTWSHPDFLPVFAAGNNGSYSYSVVSPATAKNCLSVGSVQNNRSGHTTPVRWRAGQPNAISQFSSRGPTADGRIKPEVVAPGSWVLSTRSRLVADSQYKGVGSSSDGSNTNYAYDCGTSMSTPIVAGCAALVREWLVDRRGFTNSLPSAALMKAILTGGAKDLYKTANTTVTSAAPGFDQGWGRVQLAETLFPDGRAVILADRIPFRQGHTWSIDVVTTNAAALDVQLVWTDHPGTVGSDFAIVNDLDLEVTDADGTLRYGNGGAAADTVNTVESVRIASAPAGAYRITVRSSSVAYDSGEGGAAALYVRGAFAEETTPRPQEEDFALVRRHAWSPADSAELCDVAEDWRSTGEVVRVEVPASSPLGVEAWASGARTFRVGDVRVADSLGNEVVKSDPATGRMATNFTWRLKADVTHFRFEYYDEADAVAGSSVPKWWYFRNLYSTAAWLGLPMDEAAAADFDGDGATNESEWLADTDPLDAESDFRIVSVSTSNVVWRGGESRMQVVEAASSLGADAKWEGVFTNLPPTPRTCSFEFVPAATSRFVRVRIP